MTSFTLSAEQEGLVAGVRRVAEEELRPLAEAGEPGRVNRPLIQIQAMGRHGLLARLFPGVAAAGEPGGRVDDDAAGPVAGVAAIDLCLLRDVVDAAIQVHGARALQRGHLLERLYREVRAPRIYEGASEVQRTIIGRSLLRPALDGGGIQA